MNLAGLQDRLTRQRGANRIGMVMTIADVEELLAIIHAQRRLAQRALLALLDHDLATIRACCREIVEVKRGR